MDEKTVLKYAEYLNSAELEKRDVFRLTLEHPELTVEEGYQIQRKIVELKKAGGEKLVGMKMGLTSEAKIKQMKVDNPIFGHLFGYMDKTVTGECSMSGLIHPRIEPEIAFIMGKDLSGSDLTIEQVMDAVEYVAAAMEIVDSRFENFNFKITDVVADNSSSSRFVLSKALKKPAGMTLDKLGVTLSINGEVKGTGTGADVLGHPAKPVAILAKMLAVYGEKIHAGQIILTGGITAAFALQTGDVATAKIDELGEVSLRMTV